MERKILEEQLGTVNQSLFYLTLIILSVLISFWSVLVQREQLEQALTGDAQNAAPPDLFPIRRIASALTVSALGFFFVLALRTCRDAAQGDDPAAQKSAGMNVRASFFVLTAALIRLYDLNFTEAVRRCQAAENAQPGQARTGRGAEVCQGPLSGTGQGETRDGSRASPCPVCLRPSGAAAVPPWTDGRRRFFTFVCRAAGQFEKCPST